MLANVPPGTQSGDRRCYFPMRSLPALRLLAVTSALTLRAATAAELPPDYRFKVETLLEGTPQPMELEIAPDGRIFFNEYGGKLKIYRPETRQVIEAGKLDVFTGQENGFLGFALDPKFSENGWVYCLWSPKDFEGQYLSRFTMQGDVLDLASEKRILKFLEQRKECCHHAGTVEFGPDGCLYFSTGDNTHPHGDSEGFAPIDERAGKAPWDAQKSAANTNSWNGKIIRIRPKADGTYEIPEGNLFPPGTPDTLPEIYVMGCRNPWRMSVDEKTGYVYWGEVGPDAGDDGARGTRGYDELNQAKKAGNFGWPYFVGNNFPYADYDYAAKQVGKLFDAQAPLNEGPNNTGVRVLPPAQPAMVYWPYRQPREFLEMGEGGRTACAGPVFHWRPEFEQTNGFPKEFDGALLFWDWERPTIRWAKLDKNSNLQGILPFTGAVVLANKPEQVEKVKPALDAGAALLKRPVDAVFGKDGALYLLDYGETWGANKDSKLVKISYVRGNLPPVAVARVQPAAGREPLVVTLTSEGSKDHEGGALKYEWRLQPGSRVVSSEASAQFTVAEPGNYVAELSVRDPQGATGTANVPFIVGNTAPEVRFESPAEGDFFTPGQPVKYRVAITDAEDGSSAAKADEFSLRTLVSSSFAAADGKDEPAAPGLALMKSSDCFNCHAVEQQIVGPSLVAIAEKYRNDPGAQDGVVRRVREGSTGIWGQVPMLPHPQHTTDEVTIMLRWILSLEKGKGGPMLTRGLEGEVVPPKSEKAGRFVIEANYTDAGRAPAGVLSGSARVALRSRRLEAENGQVEGAMKTGTAVGSINHGHSVRFPGINLAAVKAITARASSGNVGGTIEFRTGSPTGTLLGSVEVPNTGGWDKWIEPQIALPSGCGPRAHRHLCRLRESRQRRADEFGLGAVRIG